VVGLCAVDGLELDGVPCALRGWLCVVDGVVVCARSRVASVGALF
jgi:hypothetical protein